MKLIIEINALGNGGHRNQTIPCDMAVPYGWAEVPDNVETPNFPFGEIETEEVNGVMTVTKWTAGTIPEEEPPKLTKVEMLIEALYKAGKLTEEEYKAITEGDANES